LAEVVKVKQDWEAVRAKLKRMNCKVHGQVQSLEFSTDDVVRLWRSMQGYGEWWSQWLGLLGRRLR